VNASQTHTHTRRKSYLARTENTFIGTTEKLGQNFRLKTDEKFFVRSLFFSVPRHFLCAEKKKAIQKKKAIPHIKVTE
jgi:hypothetical protein